MLSNQMQIIKLKVRQNKHLCIKNMEQCDKLYHDYNDLKKQINSLNWFVADQNIIDHNKNIINNAIDGYNELYNNVVKRFNKFIGPNYIFKPLHHKNHNQLLQLMDKKNLELFYKFGSINDMAVVMSVRTYITM